MTTFYRKYIFLFKEVLIIGDLSFEILLQIAFSIILEQHGFPPRKVSLPFLCERFGLQAYRLDRTQQVLCLTAIH